MRLTPYQFLCKSLWVAIILSCSSCLSTQKMDLFISDQYNNQVPKLDKKKNPEITVTSNYPQDFTNISNTINKTSKVLPLIVYWQYEYRRISTLNPIIAVNTFANNINTNANKGINQKLNGKKLQLVVEQVPHYFSFVDKAHIILLVYPISWDKVYIEPDFDDMVVSYKVIENENAAKSGKIVIKNNAHNKKVGVYTSWKKTLSNHIASYNADINAMAKEFSTKLLEEL